MYLVSDLGEVRKLEHNVAYGRSTVPQVRRAAATARGDGQAAPILLRGVQLGAGVPAEAGGSAGSCCGALDRRAVRRGWSGVTDRRGGPALARFATYRAILKLGTLVELPEIRVEMVKKGSVMSLAITDYAMLAASRWISSNFTTDPGSRAYRGFREIAPSISLFYSLEDGKLASRKISLDGA
jgi:hypothetical protein